MTAKKQAVVVVHGIGEQQPMQTIRDFVEAVWKNDNDLENPLFWNKPSSVSHSFEQRRLTTNTPLLKSSKTPVRSRIDFYEYYWAHQTVGSTWQHVKDWIHTLVWCPPWKYKNHPKSIQRLWYITWAAVLIILLSIVVLSGYTEQIERLFGPWFFKLVGVTDLIAAGALICVQILFTKYVGDVARYIRAKPENISIRQAIREGGIDLLERIHQTGDYDRIILVGHSLGSIIAYDLLNHLWARHNKFKDSQNGNNATTLSAESIDMLNKLQQLAAECGTPAFKQQEYRALQQRLFEQLRYDDPACNWLISDFISLGSPLTYADFLLFDNEEQLRQRKLDREYPTSPPVPDNSNFYYREAVDKYFLHHAAVFAPVRWTNLYMGHSCFYKGDIISGPVSRFFSYHSATNPEDIQAPADIGNTPIQEIELPWKDIYNGFCHNLYWEKSRVEPAVSSHLQQLRDTLSIY
jgi:hypothetical protein